MTADDGQLTLHDIAQISDDNVIHNICLPFFYPTQIMIERNRLVLEANEYKSEEETLVLNHSHYYSKYIHLVLCFFFSASLFRIYNLPFDADCLVIVL